VIVCLSVCLSVRMLSSGTACPNVTKFFMPQIQFRLTSVRVYELYLLTYIFIIVIRGDVLIRSVLPVSWIAVFHRCIVFFEL